MNYASPDGFRLNCLLLNISQLAEVHKASRIRSEAPPTVSRGGGGGAVGLGEALEDRVGPLVKGGELERLEGADG